MTCSIVARCPETGRLGIVALTGYLSVGARVPWIRLGVGAVATQANANIAFAAEGLNLLAHGVVPEEAISRMLATDELARQRQVALVDIHGRAAAYTGDECMSYAGHVIADGVVCLANLMSNDGVPEAMLQAWFAAEGHPLEMRLLMGLQAAQDAGGDVRGQISAAIKIADNQLGASWDDLSYDLRVDAHEAPVAELSRLVALRQAYRLAEEGREMAVAGDLDQAEAVLRRARAIAPELAEAIFWHGVMLANIGDVDAACAAVAHAVEIHPGWRGVVSRIAETGVLRVESDVLARLSTS